MKKVVRMFDWISMPITLYYKGENAHVSIPSAILSIIAYTLIIVAGFYYALLFINRGAPKAYFFTRYVEDAGTFPVNSEQMFNFIQVSDPQTNEKVPLDFSAFRIVGFDDAYSDDYMNDPSIVKTKNHWVYGNCNNDSDTKGIAHLVTQKYYLQSACIRKYYDKDKGRYFSTDESGFRWPVIVKGCSNPERTYYGIIMQRCDKADQFLKDYGGPTCKSPTDIDNVISKISFNFQIIDHYADILNYEEPFTKYFYEVTSAITPNNFAIQHLNFNPVYMKTYNGFFFENIVEENLYYFTQNEKQTIVESDLIANNRTTNGCLVGVYFWMQNTLQYYERNYDRVQDTLSDIGGISNIILIFATILNFLINQFVILLDLKNLENQTNLNFHLIRDKILQTNSTTNKISEMMQPPKYKGNNQKMRFNNINNINNNINQFSNNTSSFKDSTDIYQNNQNMNFKNDKNNFNNQNNKDLFFKRNVLLNKYYYNYFQEKSEKKENNENDNINIYSKKKSHNNKLHLFDDGYNINNKKKLNQKTYNKKSRQRKITDKNSESEENNDNDKEFKFCKYLGYMICCKRKNKTLNYYEHFRIKIISEENIIKNYFDVYNLLDSKIRKDDFEGA